MTRENEWVVPVPNPKEPGVYHGPLPWDFPALEEFEKANAEYWEDEPSAWSQLAPTMTEATFLRLQKWFRPKKTDESKEKEEE